MLSKEYKTVIIGGDFNFDLLKYGNDNNVTTFVDQNLSNLFHPLIMQPTRLKDTSQTLITYLQMI